MKTGIHPKYNDTILITCACGNVIPAGSTVESIKTELCSACHPFYTGKQKLLDTAGKVDKFMAKIKKAQAYKEQQVKTVEIEEEKEEVVEEVKPEEVVKRPILDITPPTEEASEETEEVAETPKPKAVKKAAVKKPAAKTTKKTSKK